MFWEKAKVKNAKEPHILRERSLLLSSAMKCMLMQRTFQMKNRKAELLKEKGKQNLVPTKTKSESQIAVQSTQFQYGVDYFVGDFVTVEHHRFGIRQNKIQLVGMIESFDRNGRNLTPTFKEE